MSALSLLLFLSKVILNIMSKNTLDFWQLKVKFVKINFD